MLLRYNRLIFASSLCFIAVACASIPTEMRYNPQGADNAPALLWPAPPQVPRYRYSGQLVGEQNFTLAKGAKPSVGQKLFRWLVGLGRRRHHANQLVRPQTGFVDAAGRIYVTDVGRQAVFVFDEISGKLSIWEHAEGFTEFISPVGIVAGPDGQILVADAELGRIYRFDSKGESLGSFGAEVLGRPTGLARDSASGRVYVADTDYHDIKVFDDQGKFIRRIGRPGVKPGEFNAPTHLAFANGHLYISDTLNARVQVLDTSGRVVQNIGNRGLFVGNFTRPKGVTVDTDENLYVIESYYDHLLVFDSAGHFLLPIKGRGSDIGPFYLPSGVWSDSRGRIFVADMFNGRIVIFQYLGS